MSKNFSTTDLKLIPELSELRIFDFINPENDKLIAPYLKVLGFDLEYPVEFVACQHRNLQGKVVIAYLIAGEVEINDSFQSSSWCTFEDRQIAAGYRDLGLAEDLGIAATSCRDYTEAADGFAPDQANPNELEILKQIKVLEDVLLLVRGDPYKHDGSRKLYGETTIVETPEKKRKKSERRRKPSYEYNVTVDSVEKLATDVIA